MDGVARRVLPSLTGFVAVLLASYLLSPLLPTVSLAHVGGRIAAYVWITLFVSCVVGAFRAAQPIMRGRWYPILAAGAVLLGIAMLLTHWRVPVAGDLAKFAAAWCIGATFSLLADDPLWIGGAAILAGLTDAWSVFSSHGVTKHLVQHHQATLQATTVVVPLPGYTYHEALNGFGIGVTDFTFVAIYLTSAALWQLPMRRTLVALVVGIIGTIVLDVELFDGRAVPVLPLLSVCFLVATGPAIVRLERAWRTDTPDDDPPDADDDVPTP